MKEQHRLSKVFPDKTTLWKSHLDALNLHLIPPEPQGFTLRHQTPHSQQHQCHGSLFHGDEEDDGCNRGDIAAAKHGKNNMVRTHSNHKAKVLPFKQHRLPHGSRNAKTLPASHLPCSKINFLGKSDVIICTRSF